MALQVNGRVCPEPQPSALRVVVPGVHSPSPLHEPKGIHAQASLHRIVWVPHAPHAACSEVPGIHPPWPSQSPYCHSPVAAQKRSRVPHIPQLTRSIAPGVVHVSTTHSETGSSAQLSEQRMSR